MKKTEWFVEDPRWEGSFPWIEKTIRTLGITDREDVRNPTRLTVHLFSKEKLVSLSYTEGDTEIIEYDSIEEFDKDLQSAREFYSKND